MSFSLVWLISYVCEVQDMKNSTCVVTNMWVRCRAQKKQLNIEKNKQFACFRTPPNVTVLGFCSLRRSTISCSYGLLRKSTVSSTRSWPATPNQPTCPSACLTSLASRTSTLTGQEGFFLYFLFCNSSDIFFHFDFLFWIQFSLCYFSFYCCYKFLLVSVLVLVVRAYAKSKVLQNQYWHYNLRNKKKLIAGDSQAHKLPKSQ